MPREMMNGFLLVRPLMKTGYEAILILRLLGDGVPQEKILAQFDLLCDGVMGALALTREALVRVFGQCRDGWMAEDLSGWLAVHDFYPGAVDALKRTELPLYIISTKEKRFVMALCEAAGLGIEEQQVFGLESGPKLKVLCQLYRQHDPAAVHFLEDRVKTLLDIAGKADFDLRLYFADWGYHTAGEDALAKRAEKIRVLTLEQFPVFLNTPSAF